MEHRLDLLRSQIVSLQDMLWQQSVGHISHHDTHVIPPIQLDAIAFRHEREDYTISSEHRTMISVEAFPVSQQNNHIILTLSPNIHKTVAKTVAQNMEYWLSTRLWEFENRQDIPLIQP